MANYSCKRLHDLVQLSALVLNVNCKCVTFDHKDAVRSQDLQTDELDSALNMLRLDAKLVESEVLGSCEPCRESSPQLVTPFTDKGRLAELVDFAQERD